MKKLLLCFLLLTNNVYSAVPTVEGLFRNGNNGEVSGNIIVLKAEVMRTINDNILSLIKIKNNEEKLKRAIEENEKPRYLKLIFSIENRDRIELLQVDYDDPQMENNNLLRTTHVKDVLKQIAEDVNVERELFYSISLILLMNDSRGVSNLLKKYSTNYRSNEELVNVEKRTLYENYKKYLVATKSDPDLSAELTSPFSPEDEEQKEKVKKILSSPMYIKTSQVQLSRENNKFFWNVNLENFNAKFYHRSHRLRSLSLVTENNEVRMNAGEYLVFDGVHELPKTLIIKDREDNVYLIKVMGMSSFINKGKTITERNEEYNKTLAELNKKVPELLENMSRYKFLY